MNLYNNGESQYEAKHNIYPTSSVTYRVKPSMHERQKTEQVSQTQINKDIQSHTHFNTKSFKQCGSETHN